MDTSQLKIDGMSCGSCIASVTRALQRVPGVGAVEVDLPRGVAQVTAADGTAKLPAMVDALAAAGYVAGPLSAAEGSAGAQAGRGHKAAGGGCGGGPRQGSGCCCGH